MPKAIQQQDPSHARRDPATERAMIDCLFTNPEINIPDMVPEWFTDINWKVAVEAILALKERGEDIDPLTVQAEAKKKHSVPPNMFALWTECYAGAFDIFNSESYAEILRRDLAAHRHHRHSRAVADDGHA